MSVDSTQTTGVIPPRLPSVADPQRYRGLYVFDFGEWVSIGYTSEEIAMLLESERFRDGKVYRIVRARPDGSMELRGVAPERFQAESGLFFHRAEAAAARADYRQLVDLAEQNPPPARAFVHLVENPHADPRTRYTVALIYPAEYDDDFATWLLALNYMGGDTVEGGISHVTNYYEQPATILERKQLWTTGSGSSRSREEVYANVRTAVQR